MRRRDAIGSVLAMVAVISARVTSAQVTNARPFRITVFPDMIPEVRSLLTEEMRRIGWREGREVVVADSGFQYGMPQAELAAIRVVESRPDLILTYSSRYTLALRRASAAIPIVMWTSGYPVEIGVANSLARPGGNVTGNTQYAGTGLWAKLLELLRDAKAGTKRIGVCWGYVPPAFPKEEIEPCYRELRQAASALGISVNIVEIAVPERIAPALAEINAGRPEALLITTGPAIWTVRQRLMEFAFKQRLLTITDFLWPETEQMAPLLTYAPSNEDLIRRALAYVERIRKGAMPGDLPIQLPSRFELTVNGKAAKEIGLKLPANFLLRADRVIE